MTLPPLSRDCAHALIDRFAGLRALVIGDVILDRFMPGRVTRISPEAPVPVVQFQSESVRLGGAATSRTTSSRSAARLRSSGSWVRMAATDLREQIAAIGVEPGGLVEDGARRTIEKVRIVTDRNQQLARIDYEQRPTPSQASSEKSSNESSG